MSRAARTRTSRYALEGKVAALHEVIEVIASDVGVQAEQLSALHDRLGLVRIANCDVDGSTGGIAQRRRHLRNRAIELLLTHCSRRPGPRPRSRVLQRLPGLDNTV